MPTRLWVGNVAYNSTQQELEALFLEHGKLANVSYREGFSFIEFENEDDAEAARAAIHDTEFRGRKLAVEFARSEGLRPRGGEGHPVQTLPSGCRHLYVARIPAVSTGEEVREFFAKHGQGARRWGSARRGCCSWVGR
jgi:RNA recognition motif-containing protein